MKIYVILFKCLERNFKLRGKYILRCTFGKRDDLMAHIVNKIIKICIRMQKHSAGQIMLPTNVWILFPRTYLLLTSLTAVIKYPVKLIKNKQLYFSSQLKGTVRQSAEILAAWASDSKNISRQLIFTFLFSLGPKALQWYHLNSQWRILSELAQTRISLTSTAKGLSSRWF